MPSCTGHSDQLAAHLQDLGTRPELHRPVHGASAEFVLAALAVLKTGEAYLPLDSSAPINRAAFILADAGATLLLTHRRKTRDWQPGAWRIIELDGPDAAVIAKRPATFDAVDPAPQSLAYVVYTSGSTGRPKGVEITHSNLCNLIEWHVSAFEVTAADRASQVAGVGIRRRGLGNLAASGRRTDLPDSRPTRQVSKLAALFARSWFHWAES